MKLARSSTLVATAFSLLCVASSTASAADMKGSGADIYYEAGFTIDKVSSTVVSKIRALDDKALPFKQLDYRQAATVRFTGKEAPLLVDSEVMVIPQGGSFVTVITQDEATGENAKVQFEFSYRGLFILRDQNFFPNVPIATKIFRKLPPNHSPIMEVKTVSWQADTTPFWTAWKLDFNFEVASSTASSNFLKMQRVCKEAGEFAASTIEESLSGRAHLIECELLDESGKTRNLHQEKVYLDDYGVALLTKIVTPQFVADYKISALHWQR